MSKNSVSRGSTNGAVGSEIKFAGNDTKDKMYEPKHRRKLVRVLTVVAYVFSVSLAAIMLSLFYMFIYNPGKSHGDNGNESNGMTQSFNSDFPKINEDPLHSINNSYSGIEREEPRALPLMDFETLNHKNPDKSGVTPVTSSEGKSYENSGDDKRPPLRKIIKFLEPL